MQTSIFKNNNNNINSTFSNDYNLQLGSNSRREETMFNEQWTGSLKKPLVIVKGQYSLFPNILYLYAQNNKSVKNFAYLVNTSLYCLIS